MANQLGALKLGTLEQQYPDGLPYTKYWSDIYGPPAVDLDKSARSKVRKLSQFVSHVTETAIRGADFEGIEDFPNIMPEAEKTCGTVIKAWDAALGSFNPMTDGQGDLLRAAGLLLQNNVIPSKGEFSGVKERDPSTVYEAFSSMFRRNPIQEQAPGKQLLLAAELVHKAGWVEPNPQRQAALFDKAETMYDRITQAEGNNRWVKGRMRAAAHGADIRFNRAMSEFEEVQRRKDVPAQHRVISKLERLMRERASNVEELYHYYKGHKGETGGEIKGLLFELFVPLAVRDIIVSDLHPGVKDTRYEVRHAFSSEDQSAAGITPRPSFDLVVQRYVDDGIVTTPVELKIGVGRGVSEKVERKQHLEGIVLVRKEDLDPSQIYEAASALRKKYSRPGNREFHGDAEAFQDLQQDLGRRLMVLA